MAHSKGNRRHAGAVRLGSLFFRTETLGHRRALLHGGGRRVETALVRIRLVQSSIWGTYGEMAGEDVRTQGVHRSDLREDGNEDVQEIHLG